MTHQRLPLCRRLQLAVSALLLSAFFLAGYEVSSTTGVRAAEATPPSPAAASPAVSAQASDTSYALTWNEGANFTVVEFWNAGSRVGCDYASKPWPQAELAAQRAYVLGARQILRDEWDMNTWIAKNRAGNSQIRIHGAETNCPNGHIDYPPHFHVFYLAISGSGEWTHINSHDYPDAQGKITESFIIPNLCGQTTSYQPGVNNWVNTLDETCATAWQQRFTSSGSLEMRRSSSAPIYALRVNSTNGDLASLDVLLNGQAIYTIDIVQYDPVAFRMVANIKDYRKNTMVTESWSGDPAKGINLTNHTVKAAALSGGPAPTSTPGPAPTPSRNLGVQQYLPLVRR